MKLTKSWLARFAAAALSLPVAACGGDDAPQTLRMYVLDCGNIEILNLSVFQPGLGPGVVKDLAVTCYLLVHPSKGTLLYDTGVGDNYVGKGKTLIQGFANFSASKSLAEQLKQIGHPADTIKNLAMSHLHLDHTGNTNLFPKAMHLIQVEEFAAGFDGTANLVGDLSLVASLKNNPVTKFTADFDVFGDGSVTLKRTLGHTPGHQSLFVKLSKTGNVYLSGDMVHYSDNWVKKVVPGFNFDQAASVTTMQNVERLLLDSNAFLWIGHDLEQNAGIAHAPAFHE